MRRLTLLQRFLFIFILTLSIYPACAETLAMRGQVADMLLTAADDYQPGLKRSDIIHGYEDGQTREDQPIARVEAFIMISRAFSPLPEPDKYNARLNPSNTEFSDMPAWAKPELSLDVYKRQGKKCLCAQSSLGFAE